MSQIITGDLEAHDVGTLVWEQKPVAGEAKYDGIPGYSFLKKWAVQIDVERPFTWLIPNGVGYDNPSFGVALGNFFFKDYILTMDYPRSVVSSRRVQR